MSWLIADVCETYFHCRFRCASGFEGTQCEILPPSLVKQQGQSFANLDQTVFILVIVVGVVGMVGCVLSVLQCAYNVYAFKQNRPVSQSIKDVPEAGRSVYRARTSGLGFHSWRPHRDWSFSQNRHGDKVGSNNAMPIWSSMMTLYRQNVGGWG